MFLKSAHIKHFKSLDDVAIMFSDPITVLVGPNAVGKSNIVDCLRFVRDATAVDLEHAVSSRGGIGRVRQLSKTRPFDVSIKLEFTQPVPGAATKSALYEFAIQSRTGGNYSVASEKAAWYDAVRPSLTPKAAKFERDLSGTLTFSDSDNSYRVATDQLGLGPMRSLSQRTGWPIAHFIRNWRYSALYPNLLRLPASPDKDSALAEDGQNWASVIKAQRRSLRGRQALERVYEAMRSVVPSFEDVSVSSVGNYLVPRFRFSAGGQNKVEFDPVQLSDGTLRIFGILLALYQSPAPELLVIEEPEQTVHPGVLGVLADAFREAGEATQIIVTTHSPHFIDHFSPDQVRVVTLDNGLTKVGAIKATQMEAVKQRLMSMQDFMLAEGLLPEDA